MESKTKSERYYNAIIEDPIYASKILKDILEEEDQKKYLKQKPGTEENNNEK